LITYLSLIVFRTAHLAGLNRIAARAL